MRLLPSRPSGGARPERSRALPGPSIVLLVAVLAIGVAPLALGHPVIAQDAAGAEPVPLGEEAVAGLLRLRILEVVVGQSATDRVLAASPANDPPREGVTFVLVNVAARNAGEYPVVLAGDDFALTGDSGIVRRFVGLVSPEPALDGTLDPGATREGWVGLAAPVDEGSLLLLFDSLSLSGVWSDQLLALEVGATVPGAASDAAPNDAGVDPAAPAGFSTPIVTAEWEIELVDAVRGAAVFDLVDYRTGALGVGDATGEQDGSEWLALRVRVTNRRAGDGPSFLPPNAFALADAAGSALLDSITLTPPRPDAVGAYFPGASREGWVAFDIPLDGAAGLVRFLPYAATAADPDPRYLTYE